jgi:DNA-binding MarR family transcriptional regulator
MTLPFDPIAQAHQHWRTQGWSAAADGMAAVTSVMRAAQWWQARIDTALRPFGLTFARYEVLMLLLFSRRGALPMRVVGERLQVHPTSVTSAVDRLERQRLVRRVPHPDDRRAVLATITEDGRAAALAATQVLNRDVFGDPGLDAHDAAALVDLLTDLRRRAGDFVDEAEGEAATLASTGRPVP